MNESDVIFLGWLVLTWAVCFALSRSTGYLSDDIKEEEQVEQHV